MLFVNSFSILNFWVLRLCLYFSFTDNVENKRPSLRYRHLNCILRWTHFHRSTLPSISISYPCFLSPFLFQQLHWNHWNELSLHLTPGQFHRIHCCYHRLELEEGPFLEVKKEVKIRLFEENCNDAFSLRWVLFDYASAPVSGYRSPYIYKSAILQPWSQKRITPLRAYLSATNAAAIGGFQNSEDSKEFPPET